MKKLLLLSLVTFLIYSCSSEKKEENKNAEEIVFDMPPIDTFDVAIPAGRSYQLYLSYANASENDADSALVEFVVKDSANSKIQKYQLKQDGKPIYTDIMKTEKQNNLEFIITKWPFEKINTVKPGDAVDCDDLEASAVSANGDTLLLDIRQYCYQGDTTKTADSAKALADRLLRIKVILQ